MMGVLFVLLGSAWGGFVEEDSFHAVVFDEPLAFEALSQSLLRYSSGRSLLQWRNQALHSTH